MKDFTNFFLSYTLGSIGFIAVSTITSSFTYVHPLNNHGPEPNLSTFLPIIFGISGFLGMVAFVQEL